MKKKEVAPIETIPAFELRTTMGTFVRVARSPYKKDVFFLEIEAPDRKCFKVSRKQDKVIMAIGKEAALTMVKSLMQIINHEPK